jgi:glucose-specific phosphotransferase system IIA component
MRKKITPTVTTEFNISAPVSGKIISLDNVPDTMFSDRILGDGIAIIPLDGKFVSPVNGEVTSVADSYHAYTFLTDDGLNILVHIGLETVSLKGEGFKPLVKKVIK